MATVAGVDVSFWQDDIDWHAVRASGQEFAFMKVTEGLSYIDPTFPDNWHGAEAAGILRGAYCFFHPNQDARSQAQWFIRALREQGDHGELPCCIGLEVAAGISGPKIIEAARTWLHEVEQAFGRTPIIYSGVAFLDTQIREPDGSPPPWISDYALWLRWFPSDYEPGMSPLMPTAWPRWTFWQYGGHGWIAGIGDGLNQDLFNGTAEELRLLAEL